jgi:hypothetical protein
MYGSTDGSDLGKYGGSVDSSSSWTITDIIAGINFKGNTDYTIGTKAGNNGVCRMQGQTANSLSATMKIEKWTTTACKITFVDPEDSDDDVDSDGDVTMSRRRDPNDASNWKIKSKSRVPPLPSQTAQGEC